MTEHLPFGLRGARKPKVDAVQSIKVSQGGRAVGRAGKAQRGRTLGLRFDPFPKEPSCSSLR